MHKCTDNQLGVTVAAGTPFESWLTVCIQCCHCMHETKDNPYNCYSDLDFGNSYAFVRSSFTGGHDLQAYVFHFLSVIVVEAQHSATKALRNSPMFAFGSETPHDFDFTKMFLLFQKT